MTKTLTCACDTVYSKADVDRYRRVGMVTSNGVVYDFSFAWSAGAYFTLVREEGLSDDVDRIKCVIVLDSESVTSRCRN